MGKRFLETNSCLGTHSLGLIDEKEVQSVLASKKRAHKDFHYREGTEMCDWRGKDFPPDVTWETIKDWLNE